MIGAELHVVAGKHSGQVIPLNRKKFLIGREQDCQLRPNSELVSRHHCIFSVDDFSVRLRDLGSTNGTRVNGERILKEVVLSAGDHIVVGSLEFTLKLNDVAESDVVAGTGAQAAANEETVIAAAGSTLTELNVQQPQPAASPPEAIDQGTAGGDTTIISQPAMLPGQQPYQPMMPQMGYGYPGQMYGGYPFQPQMPMYPGYPQQMMPPGMPGYPQQQPQQYQQPDTSTATAAFPSVQLPDPSQTGAKDDAPAKGSAGAQKGNTEQSTGAADAIIKKHQQRRPG